MPSPDYKNEKVLALPYDENHKPIPALFVPIVDTGTGEILNYLPLRASDNGDGTATLEVDTELVLNGGTINVSPDVNVEKWGGVLQTGVDLTPLFQHLNVDLSTLKTETKVGSTDQTSGNATYIKTLADGTVLISGSTAAGTSLASNTSTTSLGASATFTGAYEDTSSAAFVTVSVFADQSSAVDGLKFEWSGDGVNTDVSEGSSVFANVGRAFALTSRGRFFRVRYINGATPQTIFRLHTVAHPSGTGLISRPLDKSLTDENFAQTVRSTLNGRKTDGNYVHLKTTDDGELKTDTLKWGGTLLTPADITPNIQNLDATLSTRATEATLIEVRDHLDTVEAKLQSIIDSTDTLEVNTDELESKIQSVRDQLDVLLSTRASEVTLLDIKSQTDLLTFTGTSLNVHSDDVSSSSTVTAVSRSGTSVTLLAANSNRKGATIYNDANSFLFLKLGASASTSSYTVRLVAQAYYEVPAKYTGIIDGIWASAGAGDTKVTELT